MLERWYLGAMNDGLFIINTPPRPSTDDIWHDRPDGPTLVLNVVALSQEQAQAIVDAHNRHLQDADSKELDGRDVMCFDTPDWNEDWG